MCWTALLCPFMSTLHLPPSCPVPDTNRLFIPPSVWDRPVGLPAGDEVDEEFQSVAKVVDSWSEGEKLSLGMGTSSKPEAREVDKPFTWRLGSPMLEEGLGIERKAEIRR